MHKRILATGNDDVRCQAQFHLRMPASISTQITGQAGAASLEFAEAPMSVKAVTEIGAISVHVPGDRAYAVNAGTNVGATKVSVRKDTASKHHIDARTDLGAIEIEPLP